MWYLQARLEEKLVKYNDLVKEKVRWRIDRQSGKEGGILDFPLDRTCWDCIKPNQ